MGSVKEQFIKVVSTLNRKNVFPIVYGSFGLYLQFGYSGEINDIDFIISRPEEFSICRDILLGLGFRTDPDHIRELVSDEGNVSFIDQKDIEALINEPLKIIEVSTEGVRYFNIDLRQQLRIYQEGMKSQFRRERQENSDLAKIEEIEKHIN